jgi:ABC-type multidrug transport system fused ATPase/permease subunit
LRLIDMTKLLQVILFTRRYWGLLITGFVCLLISTAFNLAVPGILREAIDNVINQGQRSYLILTAIAIVTASALRGAFAYGNSYLSEVAAQKTAYALRNALFDRLQRLSFAYHDKTQTGQLMSRATEDVEAVRMLVGRGLLGLAQTIVLFTGVSIVLLLLNWKLASLSLVFLPVIGLRAIVVSRRLRRVWRKIQQLLGNLGTLLEENLTGIRVVKAFSSEEKESQKFLAEATLLYNEELSADRQISFNAPLMIFLIGLPTALILWYGGRQVAMGNLTIGGLTQFIFYLGLMAMPVRRIGFITNIISRSISSGERILEILEQKSPVVEKPNAFDLSNMRGEVRFENVTFSYGSSGEALNNISFTAKPGDLVALTGTSGSGKSTIVNFIPRFYDVSSGRVTIDGIDVRDVTLSSLRRNVGIVQQDIFLFSATLRDNIAYGAVDASIEKIEAAAKAAHLHEFIISLPGGYDTWVGERGITLSGGEKQRLAIARTLLTNPRILILDDSTSSVDAETEYVIRKTLGNLISGRTTFVITHRLPVIRNADLILVLNDGQIVERGKHDDLIAGNSLYRQLYEAQVFATKGTANNLDGEKACIQEINLF